MNFDAEEMFLSYLNDKVPGKYLEYIVPFTSSQLSDYYERLVSMYMSANKKVVMVNNRHFSFTTQYTGFESQSDLKVMLLKEVVKMHKPSGSTLENIVPEFNHGLVLNEKKYDLMIYTVDDVDEKTFPEYDELIKIFRSYEENSNKVLHIIDSAPQMTSSWLPDAKEAEEPSTK